MIIGSFTKQPHEVLDYPTSLKEWLASGDYAISATATTDAGLTIDSTILTGGGKGVCVWLSGGTSGQKYKIQVTFVTAHGRTKEFEFILRVKES